VKQHSIERLTMDSPNASKTSWSTTTSQTPFLVSRNSCKPSMHNTGNDVENFPKKHAHLEPPETSPYRSLTPPSLTTSLAKVLHSLNGTTTTLALPRARVQLLNRRSPPLLTFPQNSGKIIS